MTFDDVLTTMRCLSLTRKTTLDKCPDQFLTGQATIAWNGLFGSSQADGEGSHQVLIEVIEPQFVLESIETLLLYLLDELLTGKSSDGSLHLSCP